MQARLKYRMHKWVFCFLGGMGGFCVSFPAAHAGVFNLSHFISPGKFAVGLEPELLTTNESALGVNVKYLQGVSDLSNLSVFLGTGSGSRQFRIGSAYTFDFFPDVEKQPGIGLALQGVFVQLAGIGTLELSAIPYIHKNLKFEHVNAEPFLSIPVGLALAQGMYQTQFTLVTGSLFHHSKNFSSVFELGVALSNTSTYISGGIVYYI